MRMLDVALDNATTRLIKAAQATALIEALPKESARTLTNTAKAVRLFVEAQEPGTARSALGDLEVLVKSMDPSACKRSLERRLEAVSKALR